MKVIKNFKIFILLFLSIFQLTSAMGENSFALADVKLYEYGEEDWSTEDDTLVAITDKKGELDYLSFEYIDKVKVDLKKLVGKGIKKSQVGFLIVNFGYLESADFSTKTGGKLKLVIKGKHYSNNKDRTFNFELKKNSSGRWLLSSDNSPVMSLGIMIEDLKDTEVDILRLPKFEKSKLEVLNCDNTRAYLRSIDINEAELQPVIKLKCKDSELARQIFNNKSENLYTREHLKLKKIDSVEIQNLEKFVLKYVDWNNKGDIYSILGSAIKYGYEGIVKSIVNKAPSFISSERLTMAFMLTRTPHGDISANKEVKIIESARAMRIYNILKEISSSEYSREIALEKLSDPDWVVGGDDASENLKILRLHNQYINVMVNELQAQGLNFKEVDSEADEFYNLRNVVMSLYSAYHTYNFYLEENKSMSQKDEIVEIYSKLWSLYNLNKFKKNEINSIVKEELKYSEEEEREFVNSILNKII